jgi:hypothetical protein
MDTDKAILTSAMVTLTSTISASVLPTQYGGKGELPAPRLLIGTGLTYFGLGILGDVAPSIAGPMAAAIAITALTYYGLPVLDNYFTGTAQQTPGKPATSKNPK